MAEIKQRGNTYTITVANGSDINGKRSRVYTTFTPTAKTPKAIEKEVQAFAFDFEKKVKEGKYLSGERMTFLEFSKVWEEEWLPKHVSLSIQERYLGLLKRHIIDHIGKMTLSKIRPLHIQEIITGMNKDGYAPATVRDMLCVANSIFKYAYKMEIIQDNPCLRCELPSIKKPDGLHFFTVDQCKRFLKYLEDTEVPSVHKSVEAKRHGEICKISEYTEYHKIPYQFVVYFYLAIYGGFRRGEIIALKWSDINFKKQTVSITKAISNTKTSGQFIKCPKTPSSVREIMLPEEVFEKLREWKIQQFELSNDLGDRWKGERGKNFDDNFIFIQMDSGLRMDVDTPTRKFADLIKMYNGQCVNEEDILPKIRLHDLRHTSASILISKNVDILTVSRRLGHSRVSTTLDIYSHSMPQMDETASNTLHEIFAEAN